ncbi:MAG TPA: SRPBCC family protein [Gemmatimonadaceae bacterium]|nr:SRPBCC family protein [Gemmatimonadaceae bacterium]
MWKWILGGIAALVLFAVWRGVARYREFTSHGNVATVTIAARADRVYASIANGDSLAGWMAQGGTVSSPRPGLLQPGDQIHVTSRDDRRGRRSEFTWTITDVQPGRSIGMQFRVTEGKSALIERRDSLVNLGDSTQVITTVSSPFADSVRTVRHDSGKVVRSAIAGFGSSLAVAALRALSASELGELKAHIEGRPVEREK